MGAVRHESQIRYDKAASRAMGQAAKWVRKNHPDVWQRLMAEAREYVADGC